MNKNYQLISFGLFWYPKLCKLTSGLTQDHLRLSFAAALKLLRRPKKVQQPLTFELWQKYLGLSEEHQQQFLQHYVTLCVWGNEALISRTCRTQPLEAELRT